MSQKTMPRKLALVVLTLLLTATPQVPSWAGTVLDRIKQTGAIVAGTRKDSIPFAYINEQGKWVGYSLDILEWIRRDTEKKLGKPIKLKLVEVTAQERFSKIKDRQIDIECSSSTFTWERQKQVDFSVSYFASGTQLLAKKDSGLGSIETLFGKKIGVLSKTTNEAAIKSQQPEAQLVIVKDHLDGLKKLQNGEIDGFAGDGILLEGLRRTTTNPKDWEIVPEYPYVYESYACMLPQDESEWRSLVNRSLIKFMEGVISDQPQAVEIFERWFGKEGVTPYSREQVNDYFQGIVNSYEWIPILDY
jgi:polar amino acid transport system substrate-binding protein